MEHSIPGYDGFYKGYSLGVARQVLQGLCNETKSFKSAAGRSSRAGAGQRLSCMSSPRPETPNPAPTAPLRFLIQPSSATSGSLIQQSTIYVPGHIILKTKKAGRTPAEKANDTGLRLMLEENKAPTSLGFGSLRFSSLACRGCLV